MAEEKLEHCGLPLVELEPRQTTVTPIGYLQRPHRFVEARGSCARCGQRFVWVVELENLVSPLGLDGPWQG